MAGSLAMIRSVADFDAIHAAGRSRSHPLLALRYRRTDAEHTRYGISTGRKLGNAVVRNRVRRRLREVLRSFADRVQPGWDVLIVCRPAAANVDQATLGATLERLMAGAGLLNEPAAVAEAGRA